VVIGFSAGGHLAALAGTQFVPGNPDAEDPIDRASSRPDYLVLGYPWIGAISQRHFAPELLQAVQPDGPLRGAARKPTLPIFSSPRHAAHLLYHTFNDQTVPVEQGLRFYEALVKAGVPSEMHIFANGPHGTGWARAMRLWTSGPACWKLAARAGIA
jgi:acetyl esterase/lipase